MDLNDIRKSLEDKKRWDVSCFTVDLYEEPGVDSSSKLPSQFDLTSWLPPDVNPFFHVGGGKKNDKRLWFAKGMKPPEIVEQLNLESCFKSGYSLMVGTTKKYKNHTHTLLTCECYRKARPTKAKKNATHSTKTQDEQKTCGVYVNIFKDDGHCQYYIRQNGGHNLHHSGHPPTAKQRRLVEKRHIPKDAIDEAEQLLCRNVDAAVIQEFIDLKHGVKLKETSIRKMRQTVLMNKFKGDGESDETTAQTLLRMFESRTSIDYVAYFGSYHEATETVRVRKECVASAFVRGDRALRFFWVVSLFLWHDDNNNNVDDGDSCVLIVILI
uniref:Uncharacterized protein n=1 Tax=Skeletonema marinoi TaxID=267567 RepID=A0A7S2PU12_9STRA|mmetsp:Transcript_30388/g.51665  ORF Transcript_30388/g.51665 Transcript_30388/m.51665 type:complete len:326 (+) Transcript_30388:42-1019(+)